MILYSICYPTENSFEVSFFFCFNIFVENVCFVQLFLYETNYKRLFIIKLKLHVFNLIFTCDLSDLKNNNNEKKWVKWNALGFF